MAAGAGMLVYAHAFSFGKMRERVKNFKIIKNFEVDRNLTLASNLIEATAHTQISK